MPYTMTRLPDAAAFAEHAQAFMLPHEAQNCLLLGMIHTAQLVPDQVPPHSLWAVMNDDATGQVAAAAMMTPPFDVALAYTPHLGAVVALADALRAHYEFLPGLRAEESAAAAFAERWEQLSGQAARLSMAQGLYQLDELLPVYGVSGHMREAAPSDFARLVTWNHAFQLEAIGRDDEARARTIVERRLGSAVAPLFVWEDAGQVVAMAGVAGPTPNGIRVNAVYTPPEHRRQGYASALVAALSQHMLDAGRRYCFLFTDLSNPTSNRIYQQIGYRRVGDDAAYDFAEPE